MNQSNNFKSKPTPAVVRYEYLKKVNSSLYRKQVKRSIQMVTFYSENYLNGRITRSDMHTMSRYFLDDIKSPVFSTQAPVAEKSEFPTKPLKMS